MQTLPFLVVQLDDHHLDDKAPAPFAEVLGKAFAGELAAISSLVGSEDPDLPRTMRHTIEGAP